MDASPDLLPRLQQATSIHVFGAGLNPERTSHTAVPELRPIPQEPTISHRLCLATADCSNPIHSIFFDCFYLKQ